MRSIREPANSGVHHAIIRGVDRLDIFEDDMDRNVFLKRAEDYMIHTDVKIIAYCLMTNHVHMILDTRDGDMSTFMHKRCTSYSEYFNKKYNRSGHLFQGRFISEPIETVDYFMTCLRYILYNPEKGGLCEFHEYKWSSYADYFGRPGITDKKLVFGVFKDIMSFRRFMFEGCPDKCMEYPQRKLCRTDEEARERIKEELGIENIGKLKDASKQYQKLIIQEMQRLGISIARINRLTGLSHGAIQRARKQPDENAANHPVIGTVAESNNNYSIQEGDYYG